MELFTLISGAMSIYNALSPVTPPSMIMTEKPSAMEAVREDDSIQFRMILDSLKKGDRIEDLDFKLGMHPKASIPITKDADYKNLYIITTNYEYVYKFNYSSCYVKAERVNITNITNGDKVDSGLIYQDYSCK